MAKSRIDETLKKIATNTSKANTPTTSSTSLGDPNCPHCGGVGYLRADVPVGHPNFGRLEICVCRQRDVSQQVREHLYSLSHLDKFIEAVYNYPTLSDSYQYAAYDGLSNHAKWLAANKKS